MLNAAHRKFRQLLSDEVLRRWTLGYILGRHEKNAPYEAHRPPYLQDTFPLPREHATLGTSALLSKGPSRERDIEFSIFGQNFLIPAGDEEAIFRRRFNDIELYLAVHRFSWLPQLSPDLDPGSIQALWDAWVRVCGDDVGGWSWHPYTAAERAINILTFGERWGFPAPLDRTVDILRTHAVIISENLEYYGDRQTGNHLANNGRGLYFLGLKLGMPRCAEMGAQILIEEAGRLFGKSGMLKEGSSHYHALLTRNYQQVLTLAENYNRTEKDVFSEIVAKARKPLSALLLPGGFPLVGDVSPDCAPQTLLEELADIGIQDPPCLSTDGWLRADFGKWGGLWHTAPDGWSQMPGHGHDDCGSFELHYETEPIFRDLGRGQYGETGEAKYYQTAFAHNSILVEDHPPYPPNKPYYTDEFRKQVCGPPPSLSGKEDRVSLIFNGFQRYRNIGAVQRDWIFLPSQLKLIDRVDGAKRHKVSRLLQSTLPVKIDGSTFVLEGKSNVYTIECDGNLSIAPAKYWAAYGDAQPATTLRVDCAATLPWTSTISVTVT